MNDAKMIYKVLEKINTRLNHFIADDEDPGLLTGFCGCALFDAYYYQLTGREKTLQRLNTIIERTVEALGERELYFSHCSGISGMMWCLQHLINKGMLDKESSENIFEEADAMLAYTMKRQLQIKKYDLLHQGLGIALYFLEKLPDVNAACYLSELVDQLEEVATVSYDGISWEDNFSGRNKIGDETIVAYNLGLAHGMPSILSVLSMIYENGIARGKCLALIEGGMQWLLKNKNRMEDNCISFYPTLVTLDHKAIGQKESRLGWCYGDLGLALTIYKIGKRLNNDFYQQEAVDMLVHILQFRNEGNGSIEDACLCHGSMGVSHIYRRMYGDTGNPVFLKGSQHWLDKTLRLAQMSDDTAGFKFFTEQGYTDNYNLLEGITGIGLALIASLDTETAPDWDRSLLIS